MSMPYLRFRATALHISIAISVALFATEVRAQSVDLHRDVGIRWTPSSSAAPLEINGIVIDVVTGDALTAAQVFLEGTDLGVLSGSDGRFTIRAPRTGTYRLSAVLIGYRRVSAPIDIAQDRGTLVQIGMRDAPISCQVDCFGQPCPSGVRVRVRDMLTGRAPDSRTVLRVTFGPDVDSASAEPDPDLPRVELAAGTVFAEDGPFGVEVAADGYATWRATDVWLEPTPCLPRSTPFLDVMLLRR